MTIFPLMHPDGTLLGNTTLETIRTLLLGGYIEENIAKPSGLIYYMPTLKGWMALEAGVPPRGK